ncbi:hypothetical protein, partial [Acinetobacter lactucae]|uniref:hypothetical protein n=1 Tax=Acinetobacter lactucae TaxID=1785128 RepID=UPI001BB3993A
DNLTIFISFVLQVSFFNILLTHNNEKQITQNNAETTMKTIIKIEPLQRKSPLFTLDSGLFITLLLELNQTQFGNLCFLHD